MTNMIQSTLDKWTNVTETVETTRKLTLEEKAKNDDQLAEILAWEAVEMREWI